MNILYNEPMSRHTTLRVGGPADRFVLVDTLEEFGQILSGCRRSRASHAVIGRGSNLLVSDDGFRGTVICTAGGFSDIRIIDTKGDDVTLFAEAGATLTALASFALQQGLTGFEFAAGIPGTVGGGVIMNAGAFGGEFGNLIREVRLFDESGEKITMLREDMGFGYRTSRIKGTQLVVTGAVLTLQKGEPTAIKSKMEDLARERSAKQPLDFASAGSTWKRPEGNFAAKLIDEAGCRGLTFGGARISEKHAGFLINTGRADAEDVTSLMRIVEERVYESSGIHLEPEIVKIGFD